MIPFPPNAQPLTPNPSPKPKPPTPQPHSNPKRFLSNMPASYFRQTNEEARLQHLGAISSMLEVQSNRPFATTLWAL